MSHPDAAQAPTSPEPTPHRLERAWLAAWARLDADLARAVTPEDMPEDLPNPIAERMSRRRAVANLQGSNAFSETPGWAIPLTRPRMTFPHLAHEMSKEEEDSWKMMELASQIESKKRPAVDDSLLERIGVSTAVNSADGRKFKRPRTKRDSQLPHTAAPPVTVLEETAASPPAGGLFTSILEGIGKNPDVPIVSAADVSGRDLARMRPISPATTASSPSSRSRSPASRSTSPFRPTSPSRTPVGSPTRSSYRKPWEQHHHQSGGDSSASESDARTRSKGITREEKADIVAIVTEVLKPMYPARIGRVADQDRPC